MGMAENQRRLFSLQDAGKAFQGGLVYLEGVQITSTLQQGISEPASNAAPAILGVSPQLGNGFAETPAAPFVRAKGAGSFPLHAALVHPHLDRRARGPGGLFASEGFGGKTPRQQLGTMATEVFLGKHRDAAIVF